MTFLCKEPQTAAKQFFFIEINARVAFGGARTILSRNPVEQCPFCEKFQSTINHNTDQQQCNYLTATMHERQLKAALNVSPFLQPPGPISRCGEGSRPNHRRVYIWECLYGIL